MGDKEKEEGGGRLGPEPSGSYSGVLVSSISGCCPVVPPRTHFLHFLLKGPSGKSDTFLSLPWDKKSVMPAAGRVEGKASAGFLGSRTGSRLGP